MGVAVFSYWNDRSLQDWTLQFRPVGGSFVDFSSSGDNVGINGRVVKVELADDGGAYLATGIDGIRFNFHNGNYSTWVAYREIDVVGTATPPTGTVIIIK